jgi:sugar lactone lactonase YvrE/anti-sigma regulatory factor (Ser/Thr protein kinase)
MYWDNNRWISKFEVPLKKKNIYTSFSDSKNNFWFGTKEDGVLVVVPNGDTAKYLYIPLPFNLVSNFLEDRDHNIWVAGFRGLLKVSPSSYDIISLPVKLKSIRNCIITPRGKIIVSDEDGKLLIVKQSPGGVEPVAIRQLNFADDFIDYYTFDEKQRLWFTTRKGQLYRLDDDMMLVNLTNIVVPKNDGLRGIAYNRKNKQLFVCADSVLLTGDENRLDTFFSKKDKKIIPIPLKIFIDEHRGSMVVQTVENGPFFISSGGEIFPLDSISLFVSFSDTAVNKNEIIIWSSDYGRGVKKYLWASDKKPELTETISGKDGLPDNYILDLASDKEGKLWIASTKGVTRMQKNPQQKWAHRDFEINEAGKVVSLSFSKFSTDVAGNIWMNLQDELLVFDLKKTEIAPVKNNVVIEKVLLYDRYTDWSSLTDSVEGYRRLPVDPVLKHNQNTLSIAFNGLQFGDNSLLEYSYRLHPLDSVWSTPTASNIVSFYQLAPGSYRFEVRSHIKGFDWSEPAIFSFIIKKPFWETWWLRLMIIFMASAIIFLLFRFRLRQLKTKAAIENQLRELEMKALKAQMNPHFIHNALNSIQSLIINHRSDEASHYISKFAKLLRQVLENADKNLISLDKELYSLQLYVDLEKLRMDMDIDYSEQVDENIIVSEIKIPPLILQPFVENALWHGLSNKEGDKKIMVSITGKENWIICEITDNGVGRKKAAESSKPFPEGSFSKAVTITTQRLADFNQSPATEPVSFIDLENNSKPAGTTVIIRIRAQFAG